MCVHFEGKIRKCGGRIKMEEIVKERLFYLLKIYPFEQKVNMYDVFLIIPCDDFVTIFLEKRML